MLLTVAMPVLLLLQVPPPLPSVSVVLAPVHTVGIPVILPALGKGFTITAVVVVVVPQPLVTALVIFAVPAVIHVTIPLDPTVAMSDAMLHVPPLTPSVSGVVAPAHTVAVPVILPPVGVVVTVKITVALPVPQLPVTI